jgi:hypothetical protein
MKNLSTVISTVILLISPLVVDAKKKAPNKIYKDILAKLEWQMLDKGLHSWDEAVTNCKNLGKGWDLPTKDDFESGLKGPVLISLPETNTKKDYPFWSQTKFDTFRVHVLYQGKVDLRDTHSKDEPVIYPVICCKKTK